MGTPTAALMGRLNSRSRRLSSRCRQKEASISRRFVTTAPPPRPSAAKRKHRELEKQHNSGWTADEVGQRHAAHLRTAPPLTVARRSKIQWSDYSVSFLSELHRQYRNQGNMAWNTQLANMDPTQSAAAWAAFGTRLGGSENIGGHHNSCRILFTDPQRRSDTALACIQRAWTHLHTQRKEGNLRAHSRGDGTVDWATLSANPSWG